MPRGDMTRVPSHLTLLLRCGTGVEAAAGAMMDWNIHKLVQTYALLAKVS
jgi:hypothetical protein